jgi:hypothetical protein
MSKDKANIKVEPEAKADLAGHVTGLRATGKSVEFDVEDKKKRTHTFALDASSAALLALASAAYVSGKKLHVVAKAANGSGVAGVDEIRFGNKPKPPKVKKQKPVKVAVVKSPAEAAAASAESKAPSA